MVTAQYEMGLTIATSVMPGAGEFVDLKAILTGVDPITGEDLTLANRAVSVIGLLPFVSSGMVRGAGQSTEDVLDSVRASRNPQSLGNLVGDQKVTKGRLVKFIDGATETSSIIADRVRRGEIKVRIHRSKEKLERAWRKKGQVDDTPEAFWDGTVIHLNKKSSTVASDLVHEGMHALDAAGGRNIWEFEEEIAAYMAARNFEIAKGLDVRHSTFEELYAHVVEVTKKGR